MESVNTYVPVERIEIVGAPAELLGYHTVRLSVNVYPENATIKDVIWDAHAENQRFVINSDGVLSVNNNAFFGGNETITATSMDNGAISDSVVVKAVPHKFVDEFCETSYRTTGNETHSKTMVCSCGRSDTTTENCVDADENRACDLCGGAAACKHTVTTAAYVRVEGTETHTVTVTCNSCGETVGEVTTVNCVDEDTDGVCDNCGGVVVEPYKAAAKAELAAYKNAADYREAQQADLTAAISAGNNAIDAAATIDDVTAALNSAKETIDMIKTDAQLTAEEQLAAAEETLAGAIETAREYCDSIKDDYPVIADDLDTRLQQAEGVLANADATTDEINTMTELVETALEAAKDAQKAADEAAEQPTEQPDKEPNKSCPVCGGLHNGNLIDNFRSLILHFIHILNHIMMDSVRIAGNMVSDAA